MRFCGAGKETLRLVVETQLEETLREVGKRCKRDFLPQRKPTQHLLKTKMEVFPFTFLLGNREKWERGMIQEVWGEEVGEVYSARSEETLQN